MDYITLVVFLLGKLTLEVNCADPCRQLEFRSALSFPGKRLINHEIRTVTSDFKDFCGALCFMEPNCVSNNMKLISPAGTKCELNNSTHFEYPDDLEARQNYMYRGSKNACGEEPCKNNGTCQAGFTNKGYRCLCSPEFKGQDCTEDVNECTSASHKCHANADCVNTHRSYNCTCKPGYTGDSHNCTDIDECAARNDSCDANSVCSNTNGSYDCQCTVGYVKNGGICEVDRCQNYQNLSDAERKQDYVTVNNKCDDTLNGWYRFQGAAGTKMAITCPPRNRCDAEFPAWLSEDHPTVAEGTVARKACIHIVGCCDKWVFIQVKNCSSYYIYKLIDPNHCDVRYCSTD